MRNPPGVRVEAVVADGGVGQERKWLGWEQPRSVRGCTYLQVWRIFEMDRKWVQMVGIARKREWKGECLIERISRRFCLNWRFCTFGEVYLLKTDERK